MRTAAASIAGLSFGLVGHSFTIRCRYWCSRSVSQLQFCDALAPFSVSWPLSLFVATVVIYQVWHGGPQRTSGSADSLATLPI